MDRRVLNFFALFFALFGSVLLVSGTDTTTFEADVSGSTISISVPDSVFFGNISKGQEVRTTGKIKVNNTGNVAIIVTPELVDSSEDVFSNLYFSFLASGPYIRIGDFSFNISAPPTQGSITSEDFYAKLDLKNYTGSLPSGINRKSADVRFIAVEQ